MVDKQFAEPGQMGIPSDDNKHVPGVLISCLATSVCGVAPWEAGSSLRRRVNSVCDMLVKATEDGCQLSTSMEVSTMP